MLSQLVDEAKYKGISDESFNRSGTNSINSSSALTETQVSSNSLANNSISQAEPEPGETGTFPLPSGEPVATTSNSLDVPVVEEERVDEVLVSSYPPPSSSSTPNRKRGHESARWLESTAVITPLEGHNDVVCAVDASGDILMTGR